MRVVGTDQGTQEPGRPYVFCSVETARPLLRLAARPDHLHAGPLPRHGRRAEGGRAASRAVREHVGVHQGRVLAADAAALADQDQGRHRPGLAAALGLLVGAVVTSQTLYAATAASLREYAVLRALGIPRWRMAMMVMAQSFWIGIIGVVLALPAVYGLA